MITLETKTSRVNAYDNRIVSIERVFDRPRGSYDVDWGMQDSDGKIVTTQGACHGMMGNLPYFKNLSGLRDFKYFITSIPYKAGLDTEKYLDLITDREESPWRLLFEGKESYFIKSKANERIAFVLEVDSATPLSFLVNFGQATRMPGESVNYINTFNHFLDKFKVSPLVAAYLSTKFYYDPTTRRYNLITSCHGHWFFSPGLSKKLFFSKSPRLDGVTLDSGLPYGGLTRHWTDTNAESAQYLIRDYLLESKPSFSGLFNKAREVQQMENPIPLHNSVGGDVIERIIKDVR